MNARIEQSRDFGAAVVDSVDQMIRWPFRLTVATMDLMMEGLHRMTGSGPRTLQSEEEYTAHGGVSDYTSVSTSSTSAPSSGPSWVSMLTGSASQDLSGDDLKYVIWSIVFTKPGFECVLASQHDELVNYAADGNSYAAVKIAKFLESARNGRCEKPEAWTDRGYLTNQPQAMSRQPDAASIGGKQDNPERGWRIPAEDQRYITFMYRVERRIPKQQAEVTRVERVTIERGRSATTAVA